ncbi:S4 domain-containing protein [Porphyromonas circumdentaria]|uniref:S4 domain-containing protein n=1 Tax=Porphyromonas circumdentaria TaxID=29524 RepID=A0A1T4MEL2_9PORP|nr:S4 domain-containing protein [Porphyromonas circumdentaria]MBB6275796.1 ribosomal 50S subunit-recycling heat shock protein [Porphyromonas circumdentaria]MDO4721699.1 S4 domain-containing protein [Porphyromonas circumdentaria]SJZ65194.1 S4 domain-containing protein [Porphyromonas circumdentaria]
MNMRINKLLSETGLGSRREVEALILEGRVMVNGVLAELADVIEEDDVVTLDGEELPVRDLIREFAAEQKMQLAQKAPIRIGSEYVDLDEDDHYRRKNFSNRGSSNHAARGAKSSRTGFKSSTSKPAKFRKHWEEEESGADAVRKHTDSRSPQKGERREKSFYPHRNREEHNFSDGKKKPYSQGNKFSSPQKKKRV